MDSFLSRAFATLVGALAAFALAAWWRTREMRAARVEKFKTGLFVLILQRTYLLNLKSQQLEPRRNHPIRAYAIHTILATPAHESIEVKALAFLLSSGEGELLNRLTVAEAKYLTVLAAVEARNSLHLSFQGKLEAAQEATSATAGSLEDLRRIAGPVISTRLEQLTDELYGATDDALASNRDSCVAAAAAFRRLFPREDLFGVEDLPSSGGAGAAA